MSAGGLLLRVVLMLSLLLNGLNAAMAGPMMLEMAQTPVARQAAAPPCHGEGHAAMPTVPAGTDTPAPDDSEHCRIKDCLRNCAQQPSLTAQIAWLPIPPPLFQAPLPVAQSALPSLPLDRITRPPIA
ncbi:CopL family metal-binding regulatory protein [uncultured Stenotrophomonas sp.]|uniref:CopL family metal-binding regulatory protein n=1 Tax=uncultured Stenotrophomonas sp. TaxID=165438 RepID=UPI0028F059CA|nr:CopL family metal-binding regulatory protein [uncultured Stenotrophomonas sp.]